MALAHDLAISIFNRALDEEVGVAVVTDNPKMFREELNNARRAEGDPKLDKITTFLPNGLNEVWLVKKETEL